MQFEPGKIVVRRGFLRDKRLAAVECGRVITDDARGLLMWVSAGSTLMRRTTLDGQSIRKLPVLDKFSVPTMLTPTEWHGGGVLILTPPDAAHSVWWFFGASGEFEGWYVNLESPAVRWAGGFDLQDHALDVWIDPDRSWRWKDEDELIERTGHPAYWEEHEVPAFWTEGKRVIAMAEAGEPPFDGSWLDFRPDPLWTPSALPSHWDVPR